MNVMSAAENTRWNATSLPYRVARRIYTIVHERIRASDWHTRRVVRDYLSRHALRKLHIGCGGNPLDGWLNTEYDSSAPFSVLYLDASRPFPIPSDSFDLVFSEHMIEHVPLGAAFNMLQECSRVLKPGGRLRISTPPLEYLIRLVVEGEPRDESYLDYHFRVWNPDAPVFTPAVVLADYYTKWGHRFVYDEPTLRAMMTKAGFGSIEKLPLNESSVPELRNLEFEERMDPGLLKLCTFTLEAVKP